MTTAQNQSSHVWGATLIQTVVSLFCCSLMAFGTFGRIREISLAFTTQAILNTVVLIVLLLNKKKKPEVLSSVLYALNILWMGLVIYYNQQYWIGEQRASDIFFGYKSVAVIIALQGARPRWVGLLCLNYLLFLAVFQYYSWPLDLRNSLSAQEPWFTLSLVGGCQFIYLQRIKIFEIAQKNIELETSAAKLRHFAEILLGIQHLANQPLQVIETATDLIDIKHPEAQPFSQKIKNSAHSIQKICQLLSVTKSHLHWNDYKLAGGVEELQSELEKLTEGLNKK